MLTGILLLDKPLGLSSNSALQRVKRLLRAEKAGHVGSLDPLATGMLPICLGEATKIAGDILSGRKRYLFTAALGHRTATGDLEGAIVETLPVPAFDRAALDGVLSRFLGKQMQVPPMYSAIKRDGQPLYKLARAGVEVERAPREIELFGFDVRAFDAASIQLEVSCSKGTYVRTLAEDLARALGTCGHVSLLRRLHVEPFEGEPMIALEAVEAAAQAGQLPALFGATAPSVRLLIRKAGHREKPLKYPASPVVAAKVRG
jgi:tRNA pseudouridine55 synthase